MARSPTAIPIDASVDGSAQGNLHAGQHALEWGTPVLYMRAPDGRIFVRPPSDRPATHEPAPTPSPVPVPRRWKRWAVAAAVAAVLAEVARLRHASAGCAGDPRVSR